MKKHFLGYICCKIKGCAYWHPMPCCIKQFSVTIWWYLISFFSCQGVACFAFVFLANRNIVDSPNYGNSYPTRELFWNINIYIFWICDNYSNRWSSIMHTNNSIRALSCEKTFLAVPDTVWGQPWPELQNVTDMADISV